MADRLLERENVQSAEEIEHRKMMSERMRALLSGEDVSLPPARPAMESDRPVLRSERVPAYQNAAYSTSEYHAPVVPASPDAPSPARRLADYVPITVGMQGLHRFGDAPVSAAVKDYAPVAPAPETPAPERGSDLFGSLLYKNGELLDTSAPAATVEAPVYEPSYAPATPAYETAPAFTPEISEDAEDEDSKPTPRTMSHQSAAEQRGTSLLAALSTRTKLVLAAVTAAVVLLLTIVCVNTAIANSLDAQIKEREEELDRLVQNYNDLTDEIADLTSPENIEAWATAHGMSR